MMWWDRGKIVVASCILAAAAGTWSSAKYISANSSQICSCNSQARCGPGRGVNDDMDDATSESACSTLDAAREWACRDAANKHFKIGQSNFNNKNNGIQIYFDFFCFCWGCISLES